ncbi:MAG: hypothetical protein WC728_15600 [Elusimicrobiota bacterium]
MTVFVSTDTVRGVAEDGVSLRDVYFGLDAYNSQFLYSNTGANQGGAYPVYVPGSERFEFSAPLTEYAGHGPGTLHFYARDFPYNVTDKPVNLCVEGTGGIGTPRIAVTQPTNNSTISTLPAIVGTAADDCDVAEVKLQIVDRSSGTVWDGSKWVPFSDPFLFPVELPGINGRTVDWSYSGVPNSELVGASFTVTAKVVDRVGHSAVSTPVTFSPAIVLTKVHCDDVARIGETALNPLVLRVVNKISGRGVPNFAVTFRISPSPEYPVVGELTVVSARTDRFGIASTVFRDLAPDGAARTEGECPECTEGSPMVCITRILPEVEIGIDKECEGGPSRAVVFKSTVAPVAGVRARLGASSVQIQMPNWDRIGAIKDKTYLWFDFWKVSGEHVILPKIFSAAEYDWPVNLGPDGWTGEPIYANVIDQPSGVDMAGCADTAYCKADRMFYGAARGWANAQCIETSPPGCQIALEQIYRAAMLAVGFGSNLAKEATNAREVTDYDSGATDATVVMAHMNHETGIAIGRVLLQGPSPPTDPNDPAIQEAVKNGITGHLEGVPCPGAVFWASRADEKSGMGAILRPLCRYR